MVKRIKDNIYGYKSSYNQIKRERSQNMKKINISLRSEMTLILTVQFICLMLAVVVIVNFIMLGSIKDLEKTYVEEQSKLAVNGFENQFRKLERIAYDWSAWNETYYFMNNPTKKYIDANLNYESLYNIEVDNMIYVDKNEEIFYNVNLMDNYIEHNKNSIIDKKQIEELKKLSISNKTENKFISGIIDSYEGPIIFAMHPITLSNGTGDTMGSLIVCEKLDDDLIRQMSEKYMLNLEIKPYNYGDAFNHGSELLCCDSILIVSNEKLISEIILKDVFFNPILKLQVTLDRDMYLIGNMGVNTLLFWTVVLVIGIGILIYRFWDKLLLKRILLLSRDVHAAAEGGSERLICSLENRNDEISLLRKEIIGMVKLIKSQGKDILEKQKVLENINVTLEKKVEERSAEILDKNKLLQESELKYKTIVSLFPDAIFKVSSEGVFLEWEGGNHDELIDFPENFVGKSMDEVFPPHFFEITIEKLHMVINSKKTESFKYQLIYNDESIDYEARMVYLSEYEIYLILRNITDSQKVIREIEYLSYHDQLTGLYNRRFFEEEYARLSNERNLPLSILLLDINGLKLVNDVFGHQAGDKLLIESSEAMRVCVRADDIVARIGGDEFSILLPKTPEEDAIILADRIKKRISDIEIQGAVGSISIGCATMVTEHMSLDYLFKKADEMMYKEKLHESQLMREKTLDSIFLNLIEGNKIEKMHIEFIHDLAVKIGEALNLTADDLRKLSLASHFHDVGKIGVKYEVLNKKSPLTEDEYEEVKRHSELGYQIIKSINNMGNISEIILHHHEAWDGSGYPDGLKGEAIPLLSRIICVVDAYEAMVHDRPYRKTKTHKEAVEELLKFAGIQFDPKIVESLIKVIANNQAD